ncbi:Poly(A) RNA polymerase, mitochondrial [Gryllus bimaculatus]|nr:Poly(A) RNA polymerase, mitochondrial [Gryllus bimaculatus]
MEVRGSVIVGDDGEENSKPPIKGGFADLGRPLEPHEKDDVPRILVKMFSNFGAITYMAVKDQKAVFEFSDRTAVQEILKCKFLKVQGSRVDCEPLQRFLHVERYQFQVELHADLMQLQSNMYNGENDQHPVQQQNLGETTLKQMSLDNRLQSLFLFVKMWARLQCLRSVSEPHHFTSYALVMMAVFYLQQLPQPVLPPIKKLMEEHKGEQQVIAGWPCSFTQDKKVVPKTRNSSSLLELTRGFFHFYQFFHFEWKIICPYLGKAIERKDMDDILNPEGELGYLLPTYVNNLQQDDGEPLHTRSAVCIQDPFEHSHNLSRSVKDEILMNFISSCGLILLLLQTAFVLTKSDFILKKD